MTEDWDAMTKQLQFAVDQAITVGDRLADRVEELEAKLEAVVNVALEECPFQFGTPKYDNWWQERHAKLAALTGDK